MGVGTRHISLQVARFAAIVCVVVTCHCEAQSLVLKNGQTVPVKNLRREGTMLMSAVEVAGQTGQVGYAVSAVDHLDFPKPPQLDEAEQALLNGKPAQALSLVEPAVAAFYPLRDIKGSYWPQAALLKSAALQAVGQADPAALLTAISQNPTDPIAAAIAKARLASGWALSGGKAKVEEALAAAEVLIAAHADDPTVLAEAWLAKGRALFAREDYEGALLAFLRLPVFYDDDLAANAQAELGSARCYLALHDDRRAARALWEIQRQHAALPEAAEAKKLIDASGADLARLVKEARDAQTASDRTLAAGL